MHTFEAAVIADMATGRPLSGVRADLLDADTLVPVQAYRDGEPVSLVSNAHGLIPEWQTEETVQRVQVKAGPVTLTRWAVELMGPPQDTGVQTLALEAGMEAHSTLNTIRRVGDTVFLQVGWKASDTATAARVAALPAWATPSSVGMTASTAGTDVFLRQDPDVYAYGVAPSTSWTYARFVYHTSAPFPSPDQLA